MQRAREGGTDGGKKKGGAEVEGLHEEKSRLWRQQQGQRSASGTAEQTGHQRRRRTETVDGGKIVK